MRWSPQAIKVILSHTTDVPLVAIQKKVRQNDAELINVLQMLVSVQRTSPLVAEGMLIDCGIDADFLPY